MGKTILAVKDLKYQLGERFVLNIPNWEVAQGEIYVILGPNGSGKSTFLRLLNFLEFPTQGKIFFQGNLVEGKAQRFSLRRQMSLVFQESLLFNSTVFDNVAYGLKIRGVKPGEVKQRVNKALAWLKIEHLADVPAYLLSGGEAQRVNLARSLVLKPLIFLLDEPLANLDAPSREKFLLESKRLFRQLNLTVVYVTHEREEALFLADHLGILINGYLVQEGKPEEVFNFPASEEVARFVGVETVLEGKVIGEDNGLVKVAVGKGEIEVAAQCQARKVILCLRPEEVVLSAQPNKSSPRNQVKALIKKIIPFGYFHKVFLDAGFPLAAFVTKPALEELNLAEGKEIWASFKATAVHLIERE